MRSIRTGEDVLAPDGSRLGTVERIVVDPTAQRVTHVVVAGRAVPIAHLADAGPDGLAADVDRTALAAFEDAGKPPYAAPGENWRPPEGYALEDFLTFVDMVGRVASQGPPYRPPVQADLGASEIHEITRGSPVWHGDERLGEVDRLLWDGTGTVTEIIVREGFPPRLRRLPVDHVSEVVANNVHVDLDRAAVRRLAEYDSLREEGDSTG